MIEIKIIPETACLMMKINDQLIDTKFYNKFEFEDMTREDIQPDIIEMVNKYLKSHITAMMETYRLVDTFHKKQIDELMYLADFTDFEISKLINKFIHINTQTADNGGYPILKQIYNILD